MFARRKFAWDAAPKIEYSSPKDWLGGLHAILQQINSPLVTTDEALLVGVMQEVAIEADREAYDWKRERNEVNAARILRRLMLWWRSPSRPDGYVWKSSTEWMAELRLTRRQVCEAVPYLQAVGVDVCQMPGPNRALHYKLVDHRRFCILLGRVLGVDSFVVMNAILNKTVSGVAFADMDANAAKSDNGLRDMEAKTAKTGQDRAVLQQYNNNTSNKTTTEQQQRGGGGFASRLSPIGHRDVYLMLRNFKVNDGVARKLSNEHSLADVREAIRQARATKGLDNPAGWVVKTLRDGVVYEADHGERDFRDDKYADFIDFGDESPDEQENPTPNPSPLRREGLQELDVAGEPETDEALWEAFVDATQETMPQLGILLGEPLGEVIGDTFVIHTMSRKVHQVGNGIQNSGLEFALRLFLRKRGDDRADRVKIRYELVEKD